MMSVPDSVQSEIPEPAAAQNARSRWQAPGAALVSTIVPGLGQVILNQPGMAALFFVAAALWISLFFRPFHLESTFHGWMFLIFGGWFLTIAACCHALRSRKGDKLPGSFWWLPALLPCTLAFPVIAHALALQAAGFRDFRIASSSMERVLRTGDVFMADMDFFQVHPMARGDIVLLKSPDTPGVVIVKRIIAVPGDTISGRSGKIILNGRVLNEPYVEHTGHPFEQLINFGPIAIPPHKFFVMGDNRDVSLDSRMPEFGLVSDTSVLGKPLYIIRTGQKYVGKPLS